MKSTMPQQCISVMRAEELKSSIFAPNKLYGGWTVNCSEIPHYAYTWPVKVRGVGKNPEGFAQVKEMYNEKFVVQLENPAWALAPGQPVVFYMGDKLIGGGFIG